MHPWCIWSRCFESCTRITELRNTIENSCKTTWYTSQDSQTKERSNNPEFADMTKNLYKVVQLNHHMGHWEHNLLLSLQRQFNNLINMIKPADPTTALQKAREDKNQRIQPPQRMPNTPSALPQEVQPGGQRPGERHGFRLAVGKIGEEDSGRHLRTETGRGIPLRPATTQSSTARYFINPTQPGTSFINPPQPGTHFINSPQPGTSFITLSNTTKKRKIVPSPLLEMTNHFDALTPTVVDVDYNDKEDTEPERQIEQMSAHTTKSKTAIRLNRHSGQAKKFWKIKLRPETTTLVISDSNLKLVTEEEVPDTWQLEVFSGAKLDHLSKLVELLGTSAPNNIVTSVGINHRSHLDSSIGKYVRGLRTAMSHSPAMGVLIPLHLRWESVESRHCFA